MADNEKLKKETTAEPVAEVSGDQAPDLTSGETSAAAESRAEVKEAANEVGDGPTVEDADQQKADDKESKDPAGDVSQQTESEAPVAIPTAQPPDEEVKPGETESPSHSEEFENPPHLNDAATDETLTVEFLIMPESFTVEEVCRFSDTILTIKKQIATRLRLQTEHIVVQINDTELDDNAAIESYNVERKPRISLELFIDYRKDDDAPFEMPDTIQVNCDYGDGSKPVPIFVKIEKPRASKRFLGGFRHKKTLTEYHNASCQTIDLRLLQKGLDRSHLNHRDTQTIKTSTKSGQTTREFGTQMARPGLYLDTSGDRIVSVREYRDSDEFTSLQVEMATKIQCFVRFTYARRRARALLRAQNDRRVQKQKDEEEKKQKDQAKRERQIERRINPRTATDFNKLQEEMDAWRNHETYRIKSSDFSSNDKAEALHELMDKELKLLQTIDKLRNDAARLNRQSRTEKRLAQMAAPKAWVLSNGDKVAVETPQIIRAREIMELYTGLGVPDLSLDERLDVLLHVKWTVKEFDCALTREIVELIDREADLLNRGRSTKSLVGLRRRMIDLFYEFACTPMFNPEAQAFRSVKMLA